MDPFQITCVTCHARLTVRSESAIGKIVACPRCSSMVQVVPPAAASAAAPPTPSQSAATAQLHAAPAATASAAPTFDEAADFGDDAASISPSTAGASHAELSTHAAKAPAPTPALPPTGWSIGPIAALAASSALAGSIIVAGVLMLFRGDDAALPLAAPAAALADASSATAPTNSAPGDSAEPEVVDDAGSANPAVASVPTPEAPETASAEAASPDDNPFAPPSANDAPPAAPAASATSAPLAPASAPPVATAADAPREPNPPKLRVDPLEFDPEGLNLSALLSGAASHPSARDVAADAPLAAVEPIASSGVPDEPSGAPDAALQPSDEVAAPAAPDVLLARRLVGITVDRMPLCQFLPLMTKLSALPVSVSTDQLRLAAVSATAPVSVDLADATVADLLAAALQPLRLEPIVQDRQIVLRRAADDKARELNYPIADLGVDGAEVVAWVKQLVEPRSWSAIDGSGDVAAEGGSLRIRQSERIGYEAILFLEQYRHARGLPLRSKYPQEFLAGGSGAAAANPRLAALATFTFSRPTPLVEVIRWWQQELGMAVLVDWPALTQDRLAPTTRVTAAAVNQPWGDALTAALEPLGLGWRTVDAGAIEITTRQSIEVQPRLAIYRVGAGGPSTVDPWRALVTRIGGVDAESTVFLDAKHRILLVRQPTPIQRALAERLGAAAPRDGD